MDDLIIRRCVTFRGGEHTGALPGKVACSPQPASRALADEARAA
jgi:hypothetical protein